MHAFTVQLSVNKLMPIFIDARIWLDPQRL